VLSELCADSVGTNAMTAPSAWAGPDLGVGIQVEKTDDCLLLKVLPMLLGDQSRSAPVEPQLAHHCTNMWSP
jgi:hypothetical protein